MMSPKRAIFAMVVAVAFLMGCAGSKSVGGGLWQMLGGQAGVSSLVNDFSAKLKKNTSVASALGDAGIESARMGLYNSIGKTAGYNIPKGGDLMSSFKGKSLEPAVVNGMSSSLTEVAKEKGLGKAEVEGLTQLWKPVEKELLASR